VTGTVLPRHPRVVYWEGGRTGFPDKLVATIDGTPVPVKLTRTSSKPFHIVAIEIDSDRTGWLRLTSPDDTTSIYRIGDDAKVATTTRTTTRRYHKKLRHSTVREVFDGLAIVVDAPAILAHVKVRRDAKGPWVELDIPPGGDGGKLLRLGELGCESNYSVPLLEHGVDVEVTLMLPDGSRAHADLGHVVLARRAHPTSDEPWVAE
jgi:hypothetical protein